MRSREGSDRGAHPDDYSDDYSTEARERAAGVSPQQATPAVQQSLRQEGFEPPRRSLVSLA